MTSPPDAKHALLGKQTAAERLSISRIGMGCWPIAGVSTLGTNDRQSIATLRRALELGINFFDTAYGYGFDGESDKLLARAFRPWPKEIVLASKVGMAFDASRNRIIDGRPETLRRQTDTLLTRLDRETVDILYLHAPDPRTDLSDSAGCIQELVQSGRARYAGVSNVNAQQMDQFVQACPSTVIVQPPFNMLQQSSLCGLADALNRHQVGSAVYWVLMKGLLAGKFDRNHQFDPSDKRLSYDVYQGQKWQAAQDLLDVLRRISREMACTVSQLVVAWTLQQSCVTSVLLGAKRPDQIEETAAALDVPLEPVVIDEINQAISQHNLASHKP
jgi:aryl-alcohol dehydrogenase-like predicted oxidoreductase